MIHALCRVAITIALAMCVTDGGTPVRPVTRSSQSDLAEAARLQRVIEKLTADRKFSEALAPAKRTLVLREKALGPMHPDVARSLNDLATVYGEQGDYRTAHSLHLRALDIRERALGPTHPQVAESLNN